MDANDRFHRDEQFTNSADLLDRLLRVSQNIRLRLNEWLGRFEMNDGRHAVLVVLAGKDERGCSQAQLAERLGQSESNVSTLIERMQRDGLVSRSKSDADRRKRVLQITSDGRSVLASIDANRATWAGRLLSGMSTNDRQRLYDLLKLLGDSLESPVEILAEPSLRLVTGAEPDFDQSVDPSTDPESPQYALRQMLQALSSFASVGFPEKDVA